MPHRTHLITRGGILTKLSKTKAPPPYIARLQFEVFAANYEEAMQTLRDVGEFAFSRDEVDMVSCEMETPNE